MHEFGTSASSQYFEWKYWILQKQNKGFLTGGQKVLKFLIPSSIEKKNKPRMCANAVEQ